MRNVLLEFDKKGEIYDEIWLVYACNPLLKKKDIIKANKNFQKTDKKYKSSIPSKFETVLHKGPREADGFGSQDIRFKAHGNENPGVGKYHNPRSSSMLWNPEENKGTSNFKGYGGLVSKTNRFSKRTELEASQEPGPGSHNSVGVWASRRDFNAAGVTANYAKPRRYRDDPPIDLKIPCFIGVIFKFFIFSVNML